MSRPRSTTSLLIMTITSTINRHVIKSQYGDDRAERLRHIDIAIFQAEHLLAELKLRRAPLAQDAA